MQPPGWGFFCHPHSQRLLQKNMSLPVFNEAVFRQIIWRYLNLNICVLVNGIYCDNDKKLFLNYKIKYCNPAAYFILDFSKLIHRFLVKYTIESRISNPVIFVLSHLVLHSDSIHVIIHFQYVTLVQRHKLAYHWKASL